MGTHVKLTSKGKTANIIFYNDENNKPPAFSMQVLDELDECINLINNTIKKYRVVIIESDSEKYFIVGADINSLQQIDQNSIEDWISKYQYVYEKLEKIPLPVIAKVSGYALGAGLELILRCDLIVGLKHSYYGQPEASLGFVPGAGGSYKLTQRIGISKSKELFFRAKIINANEAFNLGILNYVGDKDEVNIYMENLIKDIEKNDPLAISLLKNMISNVANINSYQCYYEEYLASIACLCKGESKKRIKDFLLKKTKK